MAASSSTVMYTACVGAAIFAGAYVIWGPDQFFRKKGRCPGLVNLGNTCFINTVLQSLATLPGVRQWLKEVTPLYKGPLGRALNNIIQALSQDNTNIHSPKEVVEALTVHQWKIDFQQQDAFELYHVILTTLGEEMISCPSLSDLIQIEKISDSKAWTRAGSISLLTKGPSCPLRGMLTSELHCIHCNHSLPLKYEFFNSISLTLPEYKCNLESCLLEFIKSELVYDVDCSQCSEHAGTAVKQAHMKKLQVGRAPPCLCIHLNRTTWIPDGFVRKNHSHLTFPMEMDVRRLLKREGASTGVMYQLTAVVEHRGSASSGHYITYRRCGGRGREWVCVSDTNVYSVTVAEVLSANAYMLFYCQK